MPNTDFYQTVFQNFLLFLVLVNPISKISVCFSLGSGMDSKTLRNTAARSTVFGLLVLIIFALAGTFILRTLFQIDVNSLRLAGGAVLFIIGLHALQRGEFFEVDSNRELSDLSMVPLGMPLIAGPATITAAISRTAVYGPLTITLAMTLALLVNMLIMMSAMSLGRFLERWHLLGPLVRITGLFVASIGADMAISGIIARLKC
ncbi:MAG: MarC family protein [Armatimonadota bacterium]|jgi:multiple antibiotic resistance protein